MQWKFLYIENQSVVFVFTILFIHNYRLSHNRYQAIADNRGWKRIRCLRSLKVGTWSELVLQEPELLKIFLPLLRADFAVNETYIFENENLLDCPINAFGGVQDKSVSLEHLEAWWLHTSKEFKAKIFPGDHFHLKDLQPQLLYEINKKIKKSIQPDQYSRTIL